MHGSMPPRSPDVVLTHHPHGALLIEYGHGLLHPTAHPANMSGIYRRTTNHSANQHSGLRCASGGLAV